MYQRTNKPNYNLCTNLPRMFGADFVCMLNDKYYYSNGQSYTKEHIEDYSEMKHKEEYQALMQEQLMWEAELEQQSRLFRDVRREENAKI